jgi:hypothetical protein
MEEKWDIERMAIYNTVSVGDSVPIVEGIIYLMNRRIINPGEWITMKE